MTALLAAEAAQAPFAPHVAVFIWIAGVVLTVLALVIAGVACRQRGRRPVFAMKSFRIAAILASVDAAALGTVLVSMLLGRGASEQVGTPEVDFGVWMFQFAVTSVLWGILLLIRKKLITPASIAKL
jgi:hypothetical protein